MILRWTDKKCIICNLTPEERLHRSPETANFTEEHVIPEAIGGNLVCKFLCKDCNDHLGIVEADVKTDARIRLCIQNLKDVLPDLWASMSAGQSFVIQGPDRSVGAKLKNGEIRVDSWKEDDGSLFLPIEDAWSAIHKKLLRRQSAQAEIDRAKKRFEEIPEGVRSEVVPGIDVLRRTASDVYLRLELAEIDIALLKTAFEYLALLLGRSIFDKYFDPIRSALASGLAVPECCVVEPFRQKNASCRPFHRLSAENLCSGLLVKVLLFGYLSYHVTFLGLQIPTKPISRYTLSLETREEEWV